MNPLTQVKNTQKITAREAALGVSDAGSWHAKYSDSAYIYAGNFAFDLTEGDLLAVFAQYGEIVDVNLVRDKGTGKSRGFAFLAYEDQRSTVLAVDNLNGASIAGRTIKVDHVANYKKKAEEDEEEEQRKREERGVCRAFQRGECTRGASCKFSHDEKRCADTGWGGKNDEPRWGHDKYDGYGKQYDRRKDDYSKNDEKNRIKARVESGDFIDRKKYNSEEKYPSRREVREERDDVRQSKHKNDDASRHGDDESRRDHAHKSDSWKRKDDTRHSNHVNDDDSRRHGNGESHRDHAHKSDSWKKKDDTRQHLDEESREHGRRSDANDDRREERKSKHSRR